MHNEAQRITTTHNEIDMFAMYNDAVQIKTKKSSLQRMLNKRQRNGTTENGAKRIKATL